MTDRDLICDTVSALLHAIDRLDWPAVEDALAERVDLDYTSLFGGEPATQPADQVVAGWRSLLPGFTSTQHLLGPILPVIDGAGATAEAHVRATHVIDEGTDGTRSWTVGGHYVLRLRRRGSGAWRISGMTLQLHYQEGELGLPEVARGRAVTSPRAATVPGDRS